MSASPCYEALGRGAFGNRRSATKTAGGVDAANRTRCRGAQRGPKTGGRRRGRARRGITRGRYTDGPRSRAPAQWHAPAGSAKRLRTCVRTTAERKLARPRAAVDCKRSMGSGLCVCGIKDGELWLSAKSGSPSCCTQGAWLLCGCARRHDRARPIGRAPTRTRAVNQPAHTHWERLVMKALTKHMKRGRIKPQGHRTNTSGGERSVPWIWRGKRCGLTFSAAGYNRDGPAAAASWYAQVHDRRARAFPAEPAQSATARRRRPPPNKAPLAGGPRAPGAGAPHKTPPARGAGARRGGPPVGRGRRGRRRQPGFALLLLDRALGREEEQSADYVARRRQQHGALQANHLRQLRHSHGARAADQVAARPCAAAEGRG